MTKSEKKAIIKKLEGWNFEEVISGYTFDLPFGLKNKIFFDTSDMEFGILMGICYTSIRKIESEEDLENLFNAICPEKYRLPFS